MKNSIEIPKEYGISQNYPNPFNPGTRIEYQVPVAAKVLVELFTVSGRRLAVLVNEEQEAGYYYTVVNADSYRLTSGIYLYRIIAKNSNGKGFSAVKKMVLVK